MWDSVCWRLLKYAERGVGGIEGDGPGGGETGVVVDREVGEEGNVERRVRLDPSLGGPGGGEGEGELEQKGRRRRRRKRERRKWFIVEEGEAGISRRRNSESTGCLRQKCGGDKADDAKVDGTSWRSFRLGKINRRIFHKFCSIALGLFQERKMEQKSCFALIVKPVTYI